VKGPWPTPAADRIEPTAIEYADRFPQWGSRTIATLMRIDGHNAPDSTLYRALKRTGRVREVDYQAEGRQHAEARRAAFVVPPSGSNQVWQCDFTEFETRMGGTLRTGGIADYWSKPELGYHVATTQNHRDAIETVELALAETERLLGPPQAPRRGHRPRDRRRRAGRARHRQTGRASTRAASPPSSTVTRS